MLTGAVAIEVPTEQDQQQCVDPLKQITGCITIELRYLVVDYFLLIINNLASNKPGRLKIQARKAW
jgi:hypothetical protein